MQLLEHGADVHNHGVRSYQTPLRMAVTELDMDVDMVDLLVSHGASPFLEAKDGKHADAAQCPLAVCGLNVPRWLAITHTAMHMLHTCLNKLCL